MTDDKQNDAADGATTEPEPEDAEYPAVASDDDTPSAADDHDPVGTSAARPSRLPVLIAGVALVVALAAVSAAAWLWVSERGPDQLARANRVELDRLDDALGGLRAAVGNSEQQRSSLGSSTRELGNDVDKLQRTVADRFRALESVPGRLTSLEASLAALQGISSGVRDTWLLAEAEYYMEIANAQLQLAGNAELARIALQLADERIATVADPGLTDVRRTLADELRALDSMDVPDIEGAALMLSSLAGTVDALPLRNDVATTRQRDTGVDEELSGMERALASLKNAMSDVVSVRRTDEPTRPLLPPEATGFLRSNLTLQFQAARLALLRGERPLFEQSLEDAEKWLNEYYDTDRKPVSSALETIAKLRQSQTTTERIDISQSLKLLRQFLTLRAQDREATAGQPG